MKSRWLRYIAISIFIISAVSCSVKSDDTSFLAELDSIDALILQGDTGSALKKLKKI